jgi:hypothetical protein
MAIADLPRPWFLAALTGVPMSDLLAQADEKDAEEPAATAMRASHVRHEMPCEKRMRAWPHVQRRGGRIGFAGRFRLVV